ncbi:MAG: HAD hydrolase family protein [Chitinophagaceae bacterium]|nr:HAD hydrolase family protein [Chitinophagaceae bacterium]
MKIKNVVAVGDSKDDRCMIAYAGKGIAFCTEDEILGKIADQNITERNFEPLRDLA